MYQLVAYAHDGVQRFAVDRAEMVLGSSDGCDIVLPFPGVADRHAVLHSNTGALRIEDLGSRRGVVLNGERVRDAELRELDEVRLGSIALLLEDVASPLAADDEPAAEPPPEPSLTPEGMLEHLEAVSRWVLADSSSSVTLESLILDLLADFGGGVLFLFQGEGEQLGVKFVVATDAAWLGDGEEVLQQVLDDSMPPSPSPRAQARDGHLDGRPAWIAWRALAALDRSYLLAMALPRFRPSGFSPLAGLATLADQLILGLVHHVGQYEPILFGRSRQNELVLAPGLITGESRVMQQVLGDLRAALDARGPVLLRGEAGVSKERLARSLHLSSARREGPFLVGLCDGASEMQVEADLFGARIEGKSAPVEREGRLLAADGGTLYLEDVDALPLRLQGRLMRFLRSGEVEPVDSLESRRVDVRLIASSRRSLEQEAARDRFRIDLAYRLSQRVVEVPSLRRRREDLPLLIQAAINRCCHDTGKRVHGVTVKAMESLTAYDYPGNLPELEAIVRRLVHLCPPGRPIDDAMLPAEVRLATLEGLEPELGSELELDKLVARTERAAIREALRRAGRNKSEAARQLGLSRNGLTMKMSRLGLEA
ncbi:MAG: sigma 54-interacting transcriptional regulator [Acidobacteriota bacterium]